MGLTRPSAANNTTSGARADSGATTSAPRSRVLTAPNTRAVSRGAEVASGRGSRASLTQPADFDDFPV